MKDKPCVVKLLYLARDLRSAKLYRALKRYCCGNVLDVGGWDFYITAARKGFSYTKWTTLEYAKDHLLELNDERFELVQGDGCNMHFGDNQFDTVLNIQVLEHVFEPIKMVEEIARVLKPEGYAIFLVPQTATLHAVPHHYQNFTRYWILSAMNRVKLDIVEMYPLGGVWSTIASRMMYFFLQSVRFGRMSYPEAKRNLFFYLLFPFMLLYTIISIPICLFLSLGDLAEEPNNHLCIARKPSQTETKAIEHSNPRTT